MALNAPFNGETARADGITVFVERDDGGEGYSFERSGISTKLALAEICEQVDLLPGKWWITCISSPTTIWRDLQGSRASVLNERRSPIFGEGGVSEVYFPEPHMLGRVGRIDLWRRPRRHSDALNGR